MNSNLPKFAMVMTSNDEDVKRSIREARAGLQGVSDEAAKSAPAFDAQAQAAERAANASRDLARAAELGASSAHRTIAGIGASADAAIPSMERLINAFAGISAPAANRNGRMADIDAYGQKLDQLQAKFDPLFAAQQRYQQKLGEIAEAERYGAISASAAIDARLRESNSYNALVHNLDRLAAARKAAAEGAVQSVTIVPDRGADIEAYGRRLDQLQAKFDPLFDAQQRYKQKLAEIAEAERFGAISATAAINARLQETNAYNALVNNADRLGAARKAAAEGAVARRTVTRDREADIAAFFDQRDATRARHDPRFAVLTSYREKLAEIRKDLRAGAIDQDVATAAIQRHRQAALAMVAALKGRETGSSGDRFRVQNLGYQIFDIGQSSALGMPLPMVAMQQLPQIIQLYAGQGGMNAAVKDFGTIASGAAKLATPLTLGIAGLTAVVGTSLIAWNGYLKSTKEVETAAAGLGRAVAGTASEMERAAQNGASAAGISVASARSMEAQFLRTGRIGSENFEALIGLSKNFAATLGISTDEAGQTLADMFADPAKAAQTLYQQYGLIDAATARQATNLARQNRQSEAQALLLDALPDRLASAAEATTAWGRIWDDVARRASDAADAIGGAIEAGLSAPSLDDQLALARLRAQSINGDIVLRNLPFLADSANGDLARLEAEKKTRDEADAKRKQDAENILRSQRVRSIADASGANDRRLRVEALQNDIRTLEDGQSLPNRDPALATRDASALEAKRRVLEALSNEQARLSELDRLDIQIQNERNPILRADLEARRVRIEMSDREVASEKLAAEANRARNRIIQETIASGRTQASDMQVELESRTRLNSLVASGALTSADANRLLQEEATLRPLIAAAALAEGEAKSQLEEVVSNLKAAYAGLAEQEKLASAQQFVRGQGEKLEQLRLEQALIGQNDAVRGRAIARLEVEQEIRRRGLDAQSAIAQAMRANADAAATLNRQIERQADAWDKVRGAGENAIDTIFDAASEGDFDDLLETIGKDFSKTLLELGGANPLKNALLGTDHATLSDVGGLGGIMKRLMGGTSADPGALVSQALGQNVGAMTVTAGTVMINGGVGGLPSLLNPAANDNGQVGNLLKAAGTTKTGIPLSEVVAGSGLTAKVSSEYAPRFQGLLNDLKAAGYNVSSLGEGGYSYRNVAGTGNLSRHAFGEAIDINPRANPWSHTFKTDLPSNINDLAQKNGLTWGGNWRKPDTMHFQVDKSIDNASLALNGLTKSAQTTQQGLGTLGVGMGEFGKGLTSFFPTAPGSGGTAPSGGGGFLSSIFGMLFSPQWRHASSGGVGLFAKGGVSDKPAIFGEDGTEAAVPLPDGRTIPVTLNVRQSYRPQQAAGGSGPARNAPIINNYGTNVVSYDETTDERGNRQPIITIGEQGAAAISQRGNPMRSAMQSQFGVRPARVSR